MGWCEGEREGEKECDEQKERERGGRGEKDGGERLCIRKEKPTPDVLLHVF